MIILSDAQGNIQNITPARVYQGSNEANDFNLIAPFANSNIITIGFLLPNTIDGTPQEFAQMEQPKTLTENLNTWTYKLPVAITQYYGTVRYQFKVTNQSGIIIATGSGTFEVIRGVDVDLPAEPTTDVYMQILTALSQVYADFTNKVDITYTDVQNAIEQKILNNASGLHLQRTHNEETNTLSFDDDGIKVNGSLIGTISDIANAIENHDKNENAHSDLFDIVQQKLDLKQDKEDNSLQTTNKTIVGAINEVIDGTIPVEKAINADNASNYNAGGTIDVELRNVRAVAEGQQKAIVFANNEEITNWLNGTYEREDGKLPSDLFIGQNIYTRSQNESDYWVSKLPVNTIEDLTILPIDEKILEAQYVLYDPTKNNKILATDVQNAIDILSDISIREINALNITVGEEVVDYNTTDGITVNSSGSIMYGEYSQEKSINCEFNLPIKPADNTITIDADSENKFITIKAEQDYSIVESEPTDKSEGKMIYLKSEVSLGKATINKTASGYYSKPDDVYSKISSGTATATDLENYEYILSNDNGYLIGYINLGDLTALKQYAGNSITLYYKVSNGEEQSETLTKNEDGWFVGNNLTIFTTSNLGVSDVPANYFTATIQNPESFTVSTTDTIEITRLNIGGTFITPGQISDSFDITNLKIADGEKYIALKNMVGSVVDTSLSTTSSNPVENKVITSEFNKKLENNSVLFTIATDNWQDLADKSPYKYSATLDCDYSITTTGEPIYELINDNAVNFATYGFALNEVSFGTAETIYGTPKFTFYAIEKPTDSVNLRVLITATSVELIAQEGGITS